MVFFVVFVFYLFLIESNFVSSFHSRVSCRPSVIGATALFCHNTACDGDSTSSRVTTTAATTTEHPKTIVTATRLHAFATVTAAIAAISAITLIPAEPAAADDDDNSLFIDKENKFALVIPPSWQTGYARKQPSSTNLMAKYLPEEVIPLSC